MKGRGRRAKPKARWFREDVIAWLLLAASTSVALLGMDHWLNRRVLPEARHLPAEVLEPKILVLAFDRIVREPAPNKISQAGLRRQLRALASAGFVAVSLEAIDRFYDAGEPLPEKSLLLTFDHGYLSTYDAVDPLLRELSWPAVLFVMTERQERRDPFFVYWDRVERMVASGLREIGSHGHHGHDPVPIDEAGGMGPFFIRARFLPEAGRVETWDEFRDRVRHDHERAKSILSERTRREVLAYAPPLRDVAGLSAAPEAHEAMRDLVESTYRLAFFDDKFGVNDRRSSPRRLKRMRVDPSLSAEELLRRVHLSMDLEQAETSWDQTWVSGSGEAQIEGLEGDELVLRGSRRADVWRAGSQWAEDWELEGEVFSSEGELWVVQEGSDGPEQWRFGGTSARVYLQVRSPGERTEVLASYDRALTPARWHHLAVVKRGAGVWAAIDGEPVADHPTYLPGAWRGNVGIVAWSPDATELRLRHLRFREVPFAARDLESVLPAEDIQAAIVEARHLSALSPRLYEIDERGLSRAPVDEKLLRILSRRFGWEIVPTVRIAAADPEVSSAALEQLLTDVASFDGVRVEWRGAPPELRKTVVSVLETRARELSWKRGRLLVLESEGNQ